MGRKRIVFVQFPKYDGPMSVDFGSARNMNTLSKERALAAPHPWREINNNAVKRLTPMKVFGWTAG